MAKKIILGVLFLGLVGALVVGAVNRTAAKSIEGNGAGQHGAGWAQAQENGALLAANAQGRGGQGGGRNIGQPTAPLGSAGGTASGWQGGGRNGLTEQAHTAEQTQSGQGYRGGQGNNGSAGNRQGSGPIAETQSHEWVSIAGTVTSIDALQMTVQTESGEIVVADRPWSFAQAAGFTAEVGDQVTLDGFYENGTFETGRLINGDLVVPIREDSGRPLWAGSGRGRGRTW